MVSGKAIKLIKLYHTVMLQGGGPVAPPKPVTAIRRCLFLSHFTRAGRTVQLLWFWPEQFFSR